MNAMFVWTASDVVGLFLLLLGVGLIGTVYVYVWAIEAYFGIRRWWRKRGVK